MVGSRGSHWNATDDSIRVSSSQRQVVRKIDIPIHIHNLKLETVTMRFTGCEK